MQNLNRNFEQPVSSVGIVDADTNVIGCGDELVAAWGESEAHNCTVVLKGRDESNTGRDNKDAGGLVTGSRGKSCRIARDVHRVNEMRVFGYLEYFFVSSCIPNDSLAAIVSSH
jgi:hypothetical protein